MEPLSSFTSDDDYNASMPQQPRDSDPAMAAYGQFHTEFYVITCFIFPLTLITNGSLCYTIFTSRHLLRWPLVVHILNASIGFILMSLTSAPFFITLMIHSRWIASHFWCLMYQASDFLMIHFFAVNLLMINIDRLIYVANPVTYFDKMKSHRRFAMVIFPWFAAMFATVLVIAASYDLDHAQRSQAGFCMTLLADFSMVRIITAIFYFTPFLGSMAINVLVFCCILPWKRTESRGTSMSLEEADTGASLFAYYRFSNDATEDNTVVTATPLTGHTAMKNGIILAVLNVTHLFMCFPSVFISVYNTHMFMLPFTLHLVTFLVSYLYGAILPLLWLLFKSIREEVKRAFLGKRYQPEEAPPQLPAPPAPQDVTAETRSDHLQS